MNSLTNKAKNQYYTIYKIKPLDLLVGKRAKKGCKA